MKLHEVCRKCGRQTPAVRVHEGICYECSEQEYTVPLAMEFIQHEFNEGLRSQFNLKNEFVNYVFSSDKVSSDEATEILYTNAAITAAVEGFDEQDGRFSKAMRDFCLDFVDRDLWIDFLTGAEYR